MYYSTTPYPHVNPHGPTSGASRVLRGVSWRSTALFCRTALRSHYPPDTRTYLYHGFRLALDAE